MRCLGWWVWAWALGMGGGGYPGSYSGTMEVAQYKLLRFFDMDVQPGKAYRYRVRVFLEDPNNPNMDPTNGYVNVAPRRRSLSLKVIERLNKQQADDATKSAYYVVSDWSEATAPVSLPSTSRAVCWRSGTGPHGGRRGRQPGSAKRTERQRGARRVE